MGSDLNMKNIIPTDKLLNIYISNLKNGIHDKVESKAESDRRWLRLFKKDMLDEALPRGYTRQDYIDFVHDNFEPIAHHYDYSFKNDTYKPVRFSITKVKNTYGFTRQDTGECCNFTIVRDKLRGGFTFKLQSLDYLNLPEWRV